MTSSGPARPMATLSLDLDDVWAYLRTRGDRDWESAPSVLPLAVDRLLPVLDGLGLRITVFVVGRDAGRPEGREAIRALADAGHEIASHSQLHRGELAALPAAEVEADLREAADGIEAITGRRPTGFRCPSFGSSPALVRSLVEGGYAYDASVLPTSLAPLLRLYYRARLRTGDADQPPQDLFGPPSSAALPARAVPVGHRRRPRPARAAGLHDAAPAHADAHELPPGPRRHRAGRWPSGT